jgi:signal transduction histidine kinase
MSGDLLKLALVCLVFGVPAGIWVSRSLAAPLHDLAEAARGVGQGDLTRRVKLRGSQELIDVGSAFNQMADDLEQAAALRRNLMADVAHELRTPLTVLQGNLRAILDDVFVMDKEEVTRLYDHTRHLTQLVEDLRVVTLAEARQLPLNLEPVDIGGLLREVWAGFEPIAAEKGVALDLRAPSAALMVRVDGARFRQVMHNLLSNALRHTPDGGEIAITTQMGGGGVTISIADSGEGISPEQLPHVFNRFYRGDPARSRDTGSTGLGLAIVKAIVEAHNGQVSAACNGPGKGAIFTIQLRPAIGDASIVDSRGVPI